jgi:hypothetical protein
MQLETLQQELASRAILLSLDTSGKMQCRAPKGAMTPGLVEAIKEHRAALLDCLARTPSTKPAPDNTEDATGKLKYSDPKNALTAGLADAIREHKSELVARLTYEQVRAALWTFPPRQLFTFNGQTYNRYECCLALHKHLKCGGDTESVHTFLAQLPPAPERTESQAASSPATRKKGRGRAIVYADLHQGRAITDTGAALSFPPSCSLSELLRAIHQGHTCDRLYICGELPEEYAAWLIDAGMWEEYTTGKRGHYFDKEEDAGHVARYARRARPGDEIEVRTMSSWFGDTEYTVEQARAAMVLLNQYLAHTFTPDAKAYATPALTFQSLWSTGNRIKGRKFDVLPEEIRACIHGSLGQGRIELCTLDTLEKIAGLWYYDGIFEYAALTWGMPTEIATRDNENIYSGKVPARYKIRYTVPGDWQHIGLFMTPREQLTGSSRDNTAWCYPSEKEQGRTFETWADGSELDVLVDAYAPAPEYPMNATKEQIKIANERAYNAGIELALPAWNITILERIVYTVDSSKKPLEDITKKLKDMREKVEQDAHQDTSRAVLYKLVRGAIRNILLHGIGSFHRKTRDVTYILHTSEPAPDGYTGRREINNNLVWYTLRQETEGYTQQFEHPEWSQLIWARCRARMTKWALSLPRASIIAIRTDAIATCTEQPQWKESTKVGTLREKWHITKTLKAPHDFKTLDGLVHTYVKGER